MVWEGAYAVRLTCERRDPVKSLVVEDTLLCSIAERAVEADEDGDRGDAREAPSQRVNLH